MAGEGTAIGALAVRIGADAGDLIKALADGGKAVDGLNKKVGDLTTVFKSFAGAITIGAMAAYVKNAADMADQAGKLAQKVGMTVEAFSAMRYAADIADVSVEEFSVGLRQLAKNMQEANSGAGDAFEAFKALGVEVSDHVGGQLKGTEETLLKLAEKFAGMEDGAGKTALAMKLFGRSGAELIPFLNQGRDGIEELRKEAERLGVVISEQAAKRAEEFNDNLRRLKASSDGLAISLTSDLVEGLGKAAAAMLKVKQSGSGIMNTVSALAAGIQQLFTGDDAHKWNVEFTQAAEALDLAERNLIAAKAAAMSDNAKMWPDQAAASVARMQAEVDKAAKNVARLRGIRAELLGVNDPQREEQKPQKAKAPVVMTDKERADQLKAYTDAEAQFQSDSLEAWNAYFASLVAERQKALDLEKALLDAQFQAIDDEQNREIDAARARGDADGESYTARLQILQNYLDGGVEAENAAYKQRLDALAAFSDESLKDLGGRQKIEERLKADHEYMLDQLEEQRVNQADARRRAELAKSQTFFGAMAGLMQTNSKKMFEIGKIGAIAETIVNTYSAAMKVFDSLASIPYVGYALGAAAAAAVIATGIANVNRIRSTQFGSGQVASGTFSASPNTGLPTTQVASQRETPKTVVLNLKGSTFGRDQLIDMFEAINTQTKDGSRFVVEK